MSEARLLGKEDMGGGFVFVRARSFLLVKRHFLLGLGMHFVSSSESIMITTFK